MVKLLNKAKSLSLLMIIFIFLLNLLKQPYCFAGSLNTEDWINLITQPFYSLLLPKDQASGRMYSNSAGSLRYPYIAIHNSIPIEAIAILERHFTSLGYHPIGKNTGFKINGKLIASCQIRTKRSSEYSSTNNRVYEATAECELKDQENNFIIYTGYGKAYRNSLEQLPVNVTLLAFANLGRVANVQYYSVNIEGFDNGIRTSRQQDYNEAILNAKIQAIKRAGGLLTVEQKKSRIYRHKNGNDSLEKMQSQEIENYAAGVLAPGYTIIDHGYENDGTYKVTLKGNILQDPVTALRNRTDNITAMSSASDLLRDYRVQKIFEVEKSGKNFDFAQASGVVTIRIIRTFQVETGQYCREANAFFYWTHESYNFTACRDKYAHKWYFNH